RVPTRNSARPSPSEVEDSPNWPGKPPPSAAERRRGVARGGPLDALEELVLAGEDRRDRVVAEDVHDRLGQEGRDRQDVDLVRALDRIDRNCVRDRDLRDLARGQLLERVAGEEPV